MPTLYFMYCTPGRMASFAASSVDRGALLASVSILLLSAAAWWWQVEQAAAMAAMGQMQMPLTDWLAPAGLFALLMWVVMMQAMMLPAALPVFLLYRRCLQRDSQKLAKLLLFIAAYVVLWSLFALLMTLLQGVGEQLGLLDPMVLRLPPWLGALALLMAGLFQLSQAKAACLQHCQSPLGFLQHHVRPGLSGAWRLGMHHGLYCLGCCWALMLLLLVVGAMSLWGMALLALLVLAEKWLPLGAGWRRCSGALLLLGAMLLGITALA
jgi:predicted metal-binding membrane protein